MLWIESPTNPAMEVADIPATAAAGHAAGAIVVVDNTFATPLLQQPLQLGADIVMHSATKFIAGHSDVILGAVITADDDLWTAIELRRRSLGAIPGPMEAWLALRGLRTLALRLERAQSNAAFLAQRLSSTRGSAGCATRVCRRSGPQARRGADVRLRRDPVDRARW